MSAFLIDGGNKLTGSLSVHGAKNSVLPLLAATILCKGETVLHNVPDLSDVRASMAILEHLGCVIRREGTTVIVDTTDMNRFDVPDELMREMRSSVIFLGAIMARTGGAILTFPGGCELGPRPIDLHLSAIRSLGGEIEEQSGQLRCSVGDGLKGSQIDLSFPSVGATENAMLCACGAMGTTTITNAAREPEIVDLQGLLRAMGCKVEGAGTSVITIEGGQPLRSCEYKVMPDRIVAATLLSAVAATGGDIEICDIDYRQLSTVMAVFTEAGCTVRSKANSIRLKHSGKLKAVRPIRTAPYPGFPTDAQAPVMAAFTGSVGSTMFVENMFSSRYRHVDELARMGADIRAEGKVAVVYGVTRLHSASVKAGDLRAGAALVIAGLVAEGQSQITGLEHVDRGYFEFDQSLRQLGAKITRVNL